jgi:KUP system potassium uptake protein
MVVVTITDHVPGVERAQDSAGWFRSISAVVFILLTTWKRIDARTLGEGNDAERCACRHRGHHSRARHCRCDQGRVQHALLHNLKHNKVLHERVVLLTMTTRDIPVVPLTERMRIEDLGCNFWQIEAFFGFIEDQDVPALLEQCGLRGHPFDMMDTSFFISRETLIPSVAPGMALWRERLFVSMSKNATKASEFFNVPTNRVVELGTQVEL